MQKCNCGVNNARGFEHTSWCNVRMGKLHAAPYTAEYLSTLRGQFMDALNPAIVTAVIGDNIVEGAKNPNPKDSIGSSKIPMHLWPETATVLGALGLLDGAGKYGRGNYRASPVRATIYYDALKRHVNGWFSGRPCDPDSGLPDLAHALACLAIIVDAEAAGTLVDDRDFNSGYAALIERMTPFVKQLQEKHADKSPKHYTIKDND